MIISIDVEKAFDKIQHLFLIKTLSKVGIEGAFLNIIKAICERPTANIILNGQKLRAFPLRSGTRQGCFLSPLLIQHSIGSPSHSNQTRKSNKRHPNWKGGSKTVIVSDDMTVYIENPIDSTKSTNLISEFGIQQDTKSIFRNLRHFCIPTIKYQEQKSEKKIPFDIVTRKIKYVRINLSKEVLRKLHNTEERN